MNPMQLGLALFCEIEAVRTPGRWTWERRIAGPLSTNEVRTITEIAGCWAREASAGPGGSVCFYTNQNHERHGGGI